MIKKRQRKRPSEKYHLRQTPAAKMRDLIYKLTAENQHWRDRYVGTLMMLAYDEVITDSRARELIGMDIYAWRRTWRQVCKTWADGQREAQGLLKDYLTKTGSRA